jgi:hypothetical protein
MAWSHHFVHLVMKLSAEAVRTRMNSAASPHHRIVFGKSGIGGDQATPRAPGRAPDGFAYRAGRGRRGGLAGGSSPLPTLQEPVRSGDAVRTRMNTGASPLRASGDEARCRSGENPHEQRRLTTSPDCFREIRTHVAPVAPLASVTQGTGSASDRDSKARDGLAGSSSPLPFTNSQKRSGDVVRTRMNPGASLLRASTLITRCRKR